MSTNHVPQEVGGPVDSWVDTADKLQVLGAGDSLLNQNHDKTGRDEGHGKDDTGSNQDISLTVKPESRGAPHAYIRTAEFGKNMFQFQRLNENGLKFF